jgi:hypothetical protein
MSDTTVIAGGAPSIVVDPSASVPAPASVPAQVPEEKPSWLDARLERERKSVLKELGLESLDDGKKAIAALKAEEEAKKSAAQRAAELEASLKTTKAEKDAMAEALGAHAKSQMSALTEAQRNAVAVVAGDDPAKQLKTIEALKSTWTSAAAPAASAAPPPRDTAPAPSAPKDGGTSAPPDPKAIHAELQKSNPILAARFAMANGLFDNK